MCHEHNGPHVETLYLVSLIYVDVAMYSSSASADMSGPLNVLSVSCF